ncbi:MAG: hypothetical protein IJ608_00010 [Lachnospiraceae bacterium]|nr:hypothetical protein [Lachnospiraceae bacterium]
MAEEHRTDYHAGLVAALKTKYDDRYDFMETLKELILGEKPPRLDAVVLKKDPDQHLTDEIGCFFLEHNVFEFKGYGDGININDIFKVEGYALFYMTIDKKVNEVPLETVTISVLQYRFPREVLKELEAKGCAVKERIKGIFEISGGPVIFPFQIIDAVILGPEWDVLKVLVPGATEKQIIKIQEEYEQADNDLLKQHLADVLRTAFESNEALFSKMKEAGKMSEAVERVFQKEIEEAAEKKEERIVANLLKMNEPVDKIVRACEWPADKVMTFAKKIGVTTLTL